MNALELTIRAIAIKLEDKGILKMWKLPTDYRKGPGVYGDQMPCDFMGHTSDGRVVMIECKMRESDRLTIGGKGDVKAHQATALSECDKAGGISLLVWQRGDKALISPWIHQLAAVCSYVQWGAGAELKCLEGALEDMIALSSSSREPLPDWSRQQLSPN